MYKITIASNIYFHAISLNFIGNLKNEMFEDPSYVCRGQVPFKITQHDKVINSWVSKGEKPLQHHFLHIII